MTIKVEEISTGEVNVTFSMTILVSDWDASTQFIKELKRAEKTHAVKRTNS